MQAKMVQLTSAVILCVCLFGQSVIAKPGYASGYDVDYYVSVTKCSSNIHHSFSLSVAILDRFFFILVMVQFKRFPFVNFPLEKFLHSTNPLIQLFGNSIFA